MLEAILACVLTFSASAVCLALFVSISCSIVEEIKQSKRNDARELRDIEYHEKRMKELR